MPTGLSLLWSRFNQRPALLLVLTTLIWGSNAIASNLHFWTFAQAAKRAGAKLIAIDPRRTETADKCHQHIALLPGTDAALALGLMHELIRHDWLDHDYIARHTEGWEALREEALQWPPARVAEECGITEEEVVQLARDYAQTAPAAINPATGSAFVTQQDTKSDVYKSIDRKSVV